MPKIEKLPELNFLSELYAQDAPDAMLLAEYPSSNSDDTQLRNRNKYIIHDPFPPPKRELIKVLGPHHLMCGWGNHLQVTTEVAPPNLLREHWARLFGDAGCPNWQAFDLARNDAEYITLFPHESLPAERQVVEPEMNYAIHSKEVIEKMNCPQAEVLESIQPPCIVKLTHGYAGLGNFFIREEADEAEMRKQLAAHWPEAVLVANSIIENVIGDFGVQFYLRKDGSIVWIGFTQQLFTEKMKWCGGTFSADLQGELFEDFCKLIEPAGEYLHECGYFGLVGIDILRDVDHQLYLVDVNPRLTGITPFLMCSRIFTRDGLKEGIYQASCNFHGTFAELIERAESVEKDCGARVVVLSGLEETTEASEVVTSCHLSVSSNSQEKNQKVLSNLLR